MLSIRERRKAKHLSQHDLASQIGVNQTAISQWERGVTMPTLDKAAMIAQVLDCTIDELCGRGKENENV